MEVRKIMAGLAIFFGLPIAGHAQVKPDESTSKVKKVMHYTKVGAWKHVDGQKAMDSTLTKLSVQKGFAVTKVAHDSLLTPDFLKQFQVIIWDNNTDGAASIPSMTARRAVLDYVSQGGGWLLVHGTAEHQNTWPDLRAALGTTFWRHGIQGPADIILDPEGIAHPELKWMMEGWPKTIRFSRDSWDGYTNTVRGLPGMAIIATAANGAPSVLVPPADGSRDHTYIWSRQMDKGRMLFTALGHGGNDLYNQAEGFAAKALWEHIRYLAGDFQNGCMDRNHAAFNPEARVPDGCGGVGVTGPRAGSKAGITVVHGRQRTLLNFPHGNSFSVELWNAQGALVWTRKLENLSEVRLDQGLRPGMYKLIAKDGRTIIRHRLLIL